MLSSLDAVEKTQSRFVPMTLEGMEKRHILQTLIYTNWNQSLAAELLGIGRDTVSKKMHKYKLGDSRAEAAAGDV